MFKLLRLVLPLAAAFASEAPAAPAGSASVACGLVWIEIEPGPAEVSLDGAFLDAGVWLISVPPGEHEIRVRKPGFLEYASRISVSSGESVRLDVRLVRGVEP